MADLLDLVKKFRTDAAKENDGVWTPIELAPGVTFECKIASTDSKAYRNRVLASITKLGTFEGMTDEDADRITAKHMAGAILTDWRDLTNDGVEIPYSEEFAEQLLFEMRLFREDVLIKARNRQRFVDDNLEEVVERLGKPLSGASNTGASSSARPSKSASKKATKQKAGTTGKR